MEVEGRSSQQSLDQIISLEVGRLANTSNSASTADVIGVNTEELCYSINLIARHFNHL
jgi:hypothetical protein